MAGWTGLEPATFCVTGRRSNQLSYHPAVERTAKQLTNGGQVKRTFENFPFLFSPRTASRFLPRSAGRDTLRLQHPDQRAEVVVAMTAGLRRRQTTAHRLQERIRRTIRRGIGQAHVL